MNSPIKATPHQPISARELADLSIERGLPVRTEEQALEYRKRRDAARDVQDKMADEPRILELQHYCGVDESNDGSEGGNDDGE